MERRITALVGSYREGGITEQAVDEILAGAAGAGMAPHKIRLSERRIDFCANCRSCTQTEGTGRGRCVLDDGMAALLAEIDASEALVLASPVNFGTVTALMKRFIERLVCVAWWPWGAMAPRIRNTSKPRRAVLVLSSAAPAILTRLTTGTAGLLRKVAGLLGARVVGTLCIGLAARRPDQLLGEAARRKARRLGEKLAAG